MTFLLLCLVVSFLLALLLGYLFTGRRLKSYALAGPDTVAGMLASRNRVVLYVLLAILAIFALFEALVYDLSLGIQDLPYRLLGVQLPAWSVIVVGNGTVSWGLYLSIVLGVLVGLPLGTLLACRLADNNLKGVGFFDLLTGRRSDHD